MVLVSACCSRDFLKDGGLGLDGERIPKCNACVRACVVVITSNGAGAVKSIVLGFENENAGTVKVEAAHPTV